MLKKLWLWFAQAVTLVLAWLFVLAAFKPEWLPTRVGQALPHTAPAPATEPAGRTEPAAGTQPGNAAASDGTRNPAILSYADAARRATPAVVNIFTSKEVRMPPNHPLLNDPQMRRFFGDSPGQRQRPRQQASSLGSGVIVGSDGIVLTNHHVIDAANEIEVLLADGRRAPATVMGSDPETDLAVLRVQLQDLPTLAFGDVSNAKVGDVVLAIGNPFGVGQTVTMGIVSATGRTQLGINTFENFIQTDAAINPGNSGGALIDTNGNLLGINTAIYSRTGGSLGIGFAISATTAEQVMTSIIKTGSVVRGYIGVEPQDVTPELAEAFRLPRKDGAIVAGVVRGGPADAAGVRIGDILLEVEGQAVKDTVSMLNLIAQLPPGTHARLKFLRDGRELEVPVLIGKRPKPPAQARRAE